MPVSAIEHIMLAYFPSMYKDFCQRLWQYVMQHSRCCCSGAFWVNDMHAGLCHTISHQHIRNGLVCFDPYAQSKLIAWPSCSKAFSSLLQLMTHMWSKSTHRLPIPDCCSTFVYGLCAEVSAQSSGNLAAGQRQHSRFPSAGRLPCHCRRRPSCCHARRPNAPDSGLSSQMP